MIRIGICDDEKRMALQNERLTKEILNHHKILAQIEVYGNGDFLLYDIQEKKYFDIVLLDIEMPGRNGMDIAAKIKQYLPNTYIIFITSHLKYAIESFELSVFRYIPKENIKEKLEYALLDAVKLINIEEKNEYIIATPNRFEKIAYREIMYIQKDGKNSIIVTTQGETKVRKSLIKVVEELNSEEFIFIDRGCVINIIFIKRIKDTEIIMKNGVRLQMSATRIPEIKKFLNTYWEKHI